jgi:hypothetical protein
MRKIFTNPIAIAIASVHWFVVLFAIYGEEHTNPFHLFYEPFLTKFLILLNAIPLMFASIFIYPVLSTFGENQFTLILGLIISFIPLTIQWLFIGYVFAKVIELFSRTESKLSLVDE